MSIISSWYQFALQQIAAESYLEHYLRGEELLSDALERGNTQRGFATGNAYTKLTQSQATDFVSKNQIIAHRANTASGFSATLMLNTATNEYTLSFRSTEYKNRNQGGDFERDGAGADNEINNSGFAFAQIADMEAYYAQLKRDGKLPAGTKINVTGYSLGGHLATVFTELHAAEINQTYIFNGAGRGALDGNNVAGLVAELNARMAAAGGTLLAPSAQVYGAAWYQDIVNQLKQQFRPWGVGLPGSDPGTGGLSNGADGKIVQIYGHANYDDAEYVANSGIHAPAIPVFIEDQPDITGWGGVFGSAGDFGTTHSLILMVDSLALMDTLATIDPAIDQARMEGLFAIASNQRASGGINANGQSEADSLERIINAMRPLLNATFDPLAPSRTPGDFGDAAYRNSFYQALDGLRNRAANLTGTGVVGFIDSNQFQTAGKARGEPIANAQPWSATRIAAEALKDGTAGLAYRYALTLLNPFALTGNAAIYATLNTENQFDKFDATTGIGLTDQWINDRANLLEHVLYYNLRNARYDTSIGAALPEDSGAQRFDGEDIIWEERSSGLLIQRGITTASTRYIRFGGDDNDQLAGGGADDHLYGGAGDDTLRGKDGNDYLEGGRDNDILIGGTGSDTLNGGQGLDTYLWTTNDGNDQIIDSDKKGRILINGSGIDVLVKQSATTWATADNKIILTQGATWKLGIDGGGSLDLGASFTDGDYGIYRIEAAVGGTTIRGDLAPKDDDPNTDGLQLGYDSLGNLKVTAIDDPGREDRLYGTEDADTIRGLAGNDILNGRGGNDLMEGGSGSDILIGDANNDTEWGDSALTSAFPIATALANGDTDTSQTTRGDWVDGQSGDDILVGSAAQDLLTGGTDNDLLIGGAGDDLLLGDVALQQGFADWSVTRSVEAGNTYRYLINQGATSQSDSVGGADVLYGGAGADWAMGGAGDDLVDGGSGDDVLFGDAGNDVILGGSGADVINGDSGELAENLQGADWIDGGDGNDRIWGMAGDDIIIGGKGDDTIVGGKGRDTYIYNKGDGVDTIYDDDSGPDKSILVFGEGVAKDAIKLRTGSLLLDMGSGDAIHIENWDQAHPLATQSFASFQFADGPNRTCADHLQTKSRHRRDGEWSGRAKGGAEGTSVDSRGRMAA